jgi:hypothetical protein
VSKLFCAALLVCVITGPTAGIVADESEPRIPVIYSTDLHHPHIDPDDHFDLATAFALPELDLRAIVLDCGAHQQVAPGVIPLRQMLHLAQRDVPFAIGLSAPLQSPSDLGREQGAEFQGGVELILKTLRESEVPVTVFTTGSLRDVAAALNRDPELLRQKVSRLYINIGNPATGQNAVQDEYNVGLDRQAYLRIMNSDLPIYWCPCFDGQLWQRGKTGTYWKFVQEQVLESAPAALQNFFIFALTKPPGVDPIAALTTPQDTAARQTVWKMPRNMWCTGPLLHAAGRQIVASGPDRWSAISKQSTVREVNLEVIEAFEFVPISARATQLAGGEIQVVSSSAAESSRMRVFQTRDDRYDQIMTSCLRELFADFSR